MEYKFVLLLHTCGAVKVTFSAIVSSTFTLFPLEGEALGLHPEDRALVLSAFPVAYLLAIFPVGRWCDKAELARAVLAVGIVGLGLSSAAFGICTRLSLFVAARSAQGIFTALADVAAGALVAASAGKNLAWAEGVLESCEALGWILGPPVGAVLYELLGFVSAFEAWAGLCMGILIPLQLQSRVASKASAGEYDALEEEEENSEASVLGKDSSLAAVLLRAVPTFAYGAGSGAMYAGLALEYRAMGLGVTAALQLLVAVSYLVAAPVVGQASDACDEAGLWRRLSFGWVVLAFGFGLLAAGIGGLAGPAVALLLLGLGEAYVLIPSYPLLTLASPQRPGLVAAVFNGAWAIGQGSGPFLLTAISWPSAMALASVVAVGTSPLLWWASTRQHQK